MTTPTDYPVSFLTASLRAEIADLMHDVEQLRSVDRACKPSRWRLHLKLLFRKRLGRIEELLGVIEKNTLTKTG